jgi:hypothetical protein
MYMMMMKLKKKKTIVIKRLRTNFKCKTSMCNEIDFNVIFSYVIVLQ